MTDVDVEVIGVDVELVGSSVPRHRLPVGGVGSDARPVRRVADVDGHRKAGLVGLTKTLAKEWGRYNVNVNAVGFGLIQTRLVQDLNAPGAGMEMHGHQIRLGVQPSLLESVKTACPLGRLGTPEEAAGAVLFFCSPLSDYVTGEVLICGGGLHF